MPHDVNTLRVKPHNIRQAVNTSCVGKGINNGDFPIGIDKEVFNDMVTCETTPTCY
jgi:hypothetical protein